MTNMLIIRNAQWELLAAQLEESAEGGIKSFITPTGADHTMHRVLDVPAEIHGISHPVEFEKAMTAFVGSGNAKMTQTSVDELQAGLTKRDV